MTYPTPAAYPPPPVQATVAGSGVTIAGGVANVAFASPASAEVSGGTVRALLDPATSAALTRGASGVVATYDDYVTISGSSFTRGPLALHKVDLLNPVGSTDPNTLAPTLAAQSTHYRATVTQQAGGARDGADEMYRQWHDVKDEAGNVVDLSTGCWAVVVEVRIFASTPGAQVIIVAGLSTRRNTTGGQHALAGYCTGTVALQRCTVVNATANSVTADSFTIARTVYTSIGNTSGNYRLPGGVLSTLNSGAASLEVQFTSQADASPGSIGLSVGIGTDVAGTTTGSTDFAVYACAYRLPTLGL